MFDGDAQSHLNGVGDRQYVSWGFIDFANGTYQGAAHGLSLLIVNELLPTWLSQHECIRFIERIFHGTKAITRSDGSLEEAFPHEGSFCVTALVVFDLLESLRLLKMEEAKQSHCIEIIKPLVGFLMRSDESHGLISNHLSTASAALYLWHDMTGDESAERKGRELVDRVLSNASSEGWFLEYSGADPGYQSLCLHYLSCLDELRPDLELRPWLEQGVRFLSYFVHPDGSFGGCYGSRRTRFYYPTCAEYLASEVPIAARMSSFMRQSIEDRSTVGLASMDAPNLIPMFNSYARSAVLLVQGGRPVEHALPCQDAGFEGFDFPEAKLLVRATLDHYTVIGLGLGGVVQSYSRDGGSKCIDCGTVFEDQNRHYSTQTEDPEQTFYEQGGGLVISLHPTPILSRSPAPWEFLILRVLCMTVMRIPCLRDRIKQMMAGMLLTRKKFYPRRILRRIDLGGALATVKGGWADGKAGPELRSGGFFKSIYMASAGYWQKGDGEKN